MVGWTSPPRLRAGELVVFDGATHTVIRVTDCAAALAKGDWTLADGTVLVRDPEEWKRVKHISPFSFIERVVLP